MTEIRPLGITAENMEFAAARKASKSGPDSSLSANHAVHPTRGMLILPPPAMSKDIRVLPLRCSVVIPSYNRLNVLPRAIGSVLAQDEPDFELIIVDDGSTDGTQAWLAALTDPRIQVIASERNRGVSAARNLGLAAARAPVVAFLDSDDTYRPQRLRRALEVHGSRARSSSARCRRRSSKSGTKSVPASCRT